MNQPPVSRRSVAVVFTVIFLDLLGFGIVIPSLAYYVAAYPVPEGALEAARWIGIADPSAVFVGLLQTAYSGLQLVAAPLWGRLSDRVGRKPVLLISLSGFAVAWVLFAFAPSVLLLVASRALAGAFGANVSTAQAYMADVFPAGERAKGMGLVGMAFGLGFVLGPVIGAGLVSETVISSLHGVDVAPDALRRMLPALAAAGLSLAAVATGLVFLQESRPGTARARTPAGPRPSLWVRLRAGRGTAFIGLLFTYFALILGFSALETMFSQFNLQILGLDQSDNALVFAVVGVTLAIVQGGLIGPLTRRFGHRPILRVGLLTLAVFLLLYGWQGSLPVQGFWVLIVITIGNSVGMSLSSPTVLALVSEGTRDDIQGSTMGLTASAATLGRTVGPIAAGLMYARLGPSWPFVMGAGLVLLSLALLPASPRGSGPAP